MPLQSRAGRCLRPAPSSSCHSAECLAPSPTGNACGYVWRAARPAVQDRSLLRRSARGPSRLKCRPCTCLPAKGYGDADVKTAGATVMPFNLARRLACLRAFALPRSLAIQEAPICSKGASVPRPTETLVNSRNATPGYRAAAACERRLGLGLTHGRPVWSYQRPRW